MANFCRFCGSPLEEGQVCACQANQAAPEAAPVATAAPAAAPAAPGLGNKLVETLKNLWKAPKATAAAVAEDPKGMTIAGIFAGVNVLAVFFFLWRIIGAWLEKNASLEGTDVEDLIEDADLVFPIFPMLIAGLAIAIIGIAVTALAVFVVGKINKQEVDLKAQILISAVNSLVPTAVIIVCTLLSLIAWWFLVVALTIVLVLWFTNILNALGQGEDSSKDALIRVSVVVLAMVIVVGLSSVLANWSIGEIEVDDKTFNERLEDARESAEDNDYNYHNQSFLHDIFDTLIVIEN